MQFHSCGSVASERRHTKCVYKGKVLCVQVVLMKKKKKKKNLALPPPTRSLPLYFEDHYSRIQRKRRARSEEARWQMNDPKKEKGWPECPSEHFFNLSTTCTAVNFRKWREWAHIPFMRKGYQLDHCHNECWDREKKPQRKEKRVEKRERERRQ